MHFQRGGGLNQGQQDMEVGGLVLLILFPLPRFLGRGILMFHSQDMLASLCMCLYKLFYS